MGYVKYIVNQVRKPKGLFGKRIARKMNISHASLAEWGLSHIRLRKDMIILDVGCGGGANINHFAQIATGGRVFGIDYSPTSVKVSKEVNKKHIQEGIVEICESSVSNLPFEDNTFDVVSGFEAYYFWPDLINDLKEIYRVLKINGDLLLVNEGYRCENKDVMKVVENWAKLGNIKLYSPKEYRDFLTEAGFSEIDIYEQKEKGWITVIAMKQEV
ncbi:MAG: class I SAM-dependent methyltransferase [Candidatus Lokiarchaeota archaeon]|nr:class I SAM-dependent methyltransferase [Candidatus Lokiarchaeota archaeon]